MNRENVEKYINFYKETCLKKLETIIVDDEGIKYQILIGGILFMEMMLEDIKNGELD